MAFKCALICVMITLVCAPALLAFDPNPLQDFCVADFSSPVGVNGFPCKDPAKATVDDFIFSGLDTPRNTNNQLGSNVTAIIVTNLPGLNTLGISFERIDYAPGGVNPPHIHPRASELLLVLEGTLYAGFVTSPPLSRAFTKVLKKGDMIVFPTAQLHFQRNLGDKPAVAISGLNSQVPGVVQTGRTLFGSTPRIDREVLARAFRITRKTVKEIQTAFAPPASVSGGSDEFESLLQGTVL